MADNGRPGRDGRRDSPDKLAERIGKEEARKLRARRQKGGEVWFGIGAFGVIGWAVAVPTVLLTFLGIWLDVRYPTRFSWTLTLLVLGLALGCFNAWYWLNRERGDIMREREDQGHKEDKSKEGE